ncbi:GNAT family N-acetyltransferase [Nocardia colli]|uniref:GNAT family N-acetyltransferase n=1 Tax=Nocardia colli TaxID=2545717 RepID=A0A5N0E9X7_9NOCA|nr:GNAT family N-acetyltransferase [Nocardia colli]KAA8886237.1 GNAT family N-acetyltransferase [Nocardia colli]
MGNEIVIRPMAAADPEPIAAAFAALGWTTKPVEQYIGYLTEQAAGKRACVVACRGGTFAGYCTLLWTAAYEPFQTTGVPEIQDLNVVPQHRNRGIGTMLLDAVEELARQRCHVVGLGVGLYADYGPAQRLYVRRGYLPDGRGVCYRNRPVEPGATIRLDDDAVLMFTRDLSSPAPSRYVGLEPALTGECAGR